MLRGIIGEFLHKGLKMTDERGARRPRARRRSRSGRCAHLGLRDRGGGRNSFYLSFARLTTVDYRNLTARTDLRRTPALIEALLGQLYLVMGVSGGVANLVPRRRLDGGNSQ